MSFTTNLIDAWPLKSKGHPFSILQSNPKMSTMYILFDIHKLASKLDISAIESNEELFINQLNV